MFTLVYTLVELKRIDFEHIFKISMQNQKIRYQKLSL